MSTATQADAKKGNTSRTKSDKPWTTFKSIEDELSALTEKQIADSGDSSHRPDVDSEKITLGEAPEMVKRLLTLVDIYTEDYISFALQRKNQIEELKAEGKDDRELRRSTIHRVIEIEQKSSLLEKLAWITIKDTFGWTEWDPYEVCKGWVIVYNPTHHMYAEEDTDIDLDKLFERVSKW